MVTAGALQRCRAAWQKWSRGFSKRNFGNLGGFLRKCWDRKYGREKKMFRVKNSASISEMKNGICCLFREKKCGA